MFQDLELTKIFQMDHTVLCRWLLTVKKNYRPEVSTKTAGGFIITPFFI